MAFILGVSRCQIGLVMLASTDVDEDSFILTSTTFLVCGEVKPTFSFRSHSMSRALPDPTGPSNTPCIALMSSVPFLLAASWMVAMYLCCSEPA